MDLKRRTGTFIIINKNNMRITIGEDIEEIVEAIWRHIIVNKVNGKKLSGDTLNNYNFLKTQRNIIKITDLEPTCTDLTNHITKTENGPKLTKLTITSHIR